MPATWKTADAGKFTCPKCGAVYEKKITQLPLRDKDSANCSVCGHEMDSWNSTEMPSYKLIERPADR
jgi:transcription elongation factor Elf1